MNSESSTVMKASLLPPCGSFKPSPVADLLILNVDPRTAILNTLRAETVMKNGRLYDAASLNQIWPDKITAPAPWFATEYLNPGDKK